MQQKLHDFLNSKAEEFNRPSFIEKDPISIPHLFTQKQDIEIAGLFAAIFAWGNRTTIINKSKELMALMNNQPYDFCLNSKKKDLKKLEGFKHRTFNATDLLYFVEFFRHHYSKHSSLEAAFTRSGKTVEEMLTGFYHYFFSTDHLGADNIPYRTRKHIASPEKNSTCKRLNMFLRWMVRKDNKGVDFGLWQTISPSELVTPIDLHVGRVARHFKLLSRAATDWQAAIELTNTLKKFDKADPVKYDFALFGLGAMEKM